jgi:hypothetical protein
VLAAAVALLLATAPPSSAVVGTYEIHQMEMGGGLELRADGHFRYALTYGAMDEEAEGDWTFDGKTVRLNSNPMPKAPEFTLVRDDPAPKGEVWLSVQKAGFGWDGGIEAIASAAGLSEKGLVRADSDGRVDSGGRVLTSIDPLVPVYGTPAGHFLLSPERGHRLLLQFHANDLGKAAFHGEPLELKEGALIMARYDSEIRFLRARP